MRVLLHVSTAILISGCATTTPQKSQPEAPASEKAISPLVAQYSERFNIPSNAPLPDLETMANKLAMLSRNVEKRYQSGNRGDTFTININNAHLMLDEHRYRMRPINVRIARGDTLFVDIYHVKYAYSGIKTSTRITVSEDRALYINGDRSGYLSPSSTHQSNSETLRGGILSAFIETAPN